MFYAEVPVIKPLRFFGSVGNDAFTLVRKSKIDRRRDFLANRGSTFDLLPNAFDRRMISKETICQILIFADQSEKQMLGFDRRAPELASFIAGEEYDPSCSLGISFEHNLLILSCSRHLTTRTPLRLVPWSTLRSRGCIDSKRCA